ncbi:polysaccharide deacetylase family protein [Bdellovibrio sp. SKB1291214]|uniref:polysaccharide deacetylase family protein n=1 Tax=Bdellovibrio sp. SKB1291214 TaxID=1732569 RepID=UPI000B515BE4|nr:polysaccharide deacetylase family protein [Bdellovibrio sp. SKB1291214]UYL07263.1 polysaccharide deacetylase family protein [Bdellovibrio sp. SKB1291214]
MRSQFLLSLILLSLPFVSRAEVEVPVKKQVCSGGGTYPVHLSFDDGPKLPETAQILDILKKNHIKATFLISTSRLSSLLKRPPNENTKKLLDLIERMKKEGHTIGSHSFDHIEHANLKENSEASIQENLRKSFMIMDKLNLPKPVPFRFPYGSGWFQEQDSTNQNMADKVMRQVKSAGYRPFHWDIDTWDWSKIKRKALPDSVLEQICLHKGGIVLAHDIHKWTAENLPAIIESIHNSGHKFVSESEIIKYSQTQAPEPLLSLADQVGSIRSCHKRLGILDQVGPVCDTGTSNKTTHGQGGVQ